MPRFIAIDGEGLTRDDGTHDYTLLAASDGSYIETYESGGLSTAECFAYLLDVGERHKDAVLVGFYTSYDVNMMFRDIARDVLERLWLGLTATWKPQGSVYQYRLEYVQNRVLKLSEGFWYYPDETDDGNPQRPRWHRKRGIVFWDCFQFFQSSFVNALNDWEAADRETLDEIKTMKDKRGTFDDAERERIRAYCMSECRLLVGMMDKVAATLEALDIRLTSWYGAGSIASAVMRREGVKRHIVREWDSIDDDVIMSAYFGGRVETFAIGVVDAITYNYDIRSAYPAAMATLPSLANSTWRHSTHYSYSLPHAIWHVSWKANRDNVRFTPFPYRHNRRIYWPHTGEGWYHAEEVRAAVDVFGDGTRGIDLSLIEGYVLDVADDTLPFAWVPELYNERAEYKRNRDPREKILKLALNSGYGKTAQGIGGKDGKPPALQCYVWGGMITAHCRAKIMRAAATIPESNLLAIATDGLFCRSRADVVERDELGAWESATVEPGLMLIQPGVYATPKLGAKHESPELKTFVKTRGFSGAKLRYAELLDQWLAHGMGGAIEIADTRFIGFGYALATNTLDTLWRRWVPGIKRIGMAGTSTKFPNLQRGLSTERLMLLNSPSQPADSQISAPYVRRERSKAELVADELTAASIDAQPDIEDNPFVWS